MIRIRPDSLEFHPGSQPKQNIEQYVIWLEMESLAKYKFRKQIIYTVNVLLRSMYVHVLDAHPHPQPEIVLMAHKFQVFHNCYKYFNAD